MADDMDEYTAVLQQELEDALELIERLNADASKEKARRDKIEQALRSECDIAKKQSAVLEDKVNSWLSSEHKCTQMREIDVHFQPKCKFLLVIR